MGELAIYLDVYDGDEEEAVNGSICFCRICHEAELESSVSLESPCACSGTAKFAHRDCIQRWCNEKGNTICEICLQRYEPGYTAPQPKMVHLVDATTVTIRGGSLEIPIIETDDDEENVQAHDDDEITNNYPRCSYTQHQTYGSSIILIFTFLLLVRHVYELVGEGGARDYPFSLPTILILKASGIFLPMYVLLRIVTLIQNTIQHNHHHYLLDSERRHNQLIR